MHLDFRQSFNRSLSTSSWVMLLKYLKFPIPPTTLPTYANLWYNLNGEKHFSSRSMSICSICAFPTSHSPPKKWTAKGTRSDYSRIVPPEGKACFPSTTCFIMMECIHPLRVTCRNFTWITKNLRCPLLLGVVVGYFKICMLQSLFSKYLSIHDKLKVAE